MTAWVFLSVKESDGENNAEAENAEGEECFESFCEWGFDQKEAEAKIDKPGGGANKSESRRSYIAAFYLYYKFLGRHAGCSIARSLLNVTN